MFKRLSLYTLLLCLVPFFVWGFTYHWHGNNQLMEWDYWLYLLTETGSVPYALITCAIFALLFRFLFENRKQWIMGVIVMGLSVLSTQVIKTGLKTVFAEPRPFTVYLAEKTESTTDAFYHQDRSERAKLVDKFYSTKPTYN